MTYLIDTNVISEVRKGARCHRAVAAWWDSVDDSDLYLSVLVLGEIRLGIEHVRRHDHTKAQRLARWLDEIGIAFSERILNVDRQVAAEWGRMSAARPVPVIDALLAATARVHRLTLVTRNERDLTGLGATILNPFEFGRKRV